MVLNKVHIQHWALAQVRVKLEEPCPGLIQESDELVDLQGTNLCQVEEI